ncbi:MAG: hypothetical protein LBQ74_14195 [Prevotella sp.]|jgi:hypothetical protein|nr:hypothetical protein [Prevotella sp.]
MAYTPEEYQILKDKYKELLAIKWSGAARVKYSDKEVEYRSLEDIKSILDEMEKELFPSENKHRRKLASYGRGFE